MLKTLFIIGAGFSVNLGAITTQDIAKAINIVVNLNKKLIDRLEEINRQILKGKLQFHLQKDLERTLLILLDGDGAGSLEEALKKRERVIDFLVKKYKQIFPDGDPEYFRYYLQDSYRKFDYLAFRSFYLQWKNSLPDDEKENVPIVRFLTLLDKAYEENISIPTKELFSRKNDRNKKVIYYNRPHRSKKALDFYKYFTYKLFKIVLAHTPNIQKTKIYYNFFRDLILETIKNPENLNVIIKRDLFVLPIEFLTFNWDPFLPFILIKANRYANKRMEINTLRNDILPQTYVDFTWNIPIVRLDKEFNSRKQKEIWDEILISEDTAYFVNKQTMKSWVYEETKIDSNLFLQLIKLYAVHGLFNIRFCPYCNQLFMIMPTKINNLNVATYEGLRDLFLLDPIPSIHDMKIVSKKYKGTLLYEAYKKGRPDELPCPNCGFPTYFEDTPLSIQTILKSDEIFFLRHLKNIVFNKLREYDHLIIIGYSFPEDDISNNFTIELYGSSKNHAEANNHNRPKKTKITIISYNPDLQSKIWYTIEEVKDRHNLGFNLHEVKKLFPDAEIRISFLGWPDILRKVSSWKEILEFK